MSKKVGIRFKPTGKVYNFDCGAYVLKSGNYVIVETELGKSFGVVDVPPEEYDPKSLKTPLKKVFRLASEDDLIQKENNFALEKEAYDYCNECINELKLDMNLFNVDSTFDQTRLTFFFTAKERVDFRKLVKMLLNKFRVKIAMKQVGIRNQARMCGGMGRCGREICCSSFMDKFAPVSIRMAKDQGLSLNPTKISGQCGRLMCCLTFENDIYQEFKEKYPKIGKIVNIPQGKGKVIRHNVIKNRLTILLDNGQEIETEVDEITESYKQEKK